MSFWKLFFFKFVLLIHVYIFFFLHEINSGFVKLKITNLKTDVFENVLLSIERPTFASEPFRSWHKSRQFEFCFWHFNFKIENGIFICRLDGFLIHKTNLEGSPYLKSYMRNMLVGRGSLHLFLLFVFRWPSSLASQTQYMPRRTSMWINTTLSWIYSSSTRRQIPCRILP